MANFLIQSDDNCFDVEKIIIEEILHRNKYIHSYKTISLDSINEKIDSDMIPIGTIEFVTKYMNITSNLNKEVPIEIPTYLQKEEFLKRNYNILKWDNIPRNGHFFLKDASELKKFANIINTKYLDIDNLFNYTPKGKFDTTLVLDKQHLYQVSDILDIDAEYRVYIIANYIDKIVCYDGDNTLYPDINLIRKAIININNNEKYLKSYTIDLAVGKFGTAILEIHNFTSVGLYHTLWGSNLLYGYIDGINYLKHDNTIKYIT